MKRNVRIATVLTAGVLAVGGVLAVTPVIADSGAGPGTAATARTASGFSTDTGHRGSMGSMGSTGHMGMGGGMARHMNGGDGTEGTGACGGTGTLAAKGTLSAAQQETLAGTAEEEKLAHDLYASFADRYDTPVFSRLAAAETRHLTAVRALLDRYDVTDPTAGRKTGEFADPAVKAAYDRLLGQGQGSEEAALKAGRTVEADDIAALTKALKGLTAPDARQVYGSLLTASQRHQDALEHWLTADGQDE
ncbi:DUF2202 domain-containing protein [Streptomyces sp. NPDC047000]|uniref:DUF2202 domain-containing protein n=1 Tax=Streptomyces sp. NPDC047000 TaxID=3155474 RepID=UPI00340EECBF